jgi:flagellar hook-associated protein 3 FlgL
MTRVSTFGQNQALLGGINRQQVELDRVQTQISTGKKSENFQGFASEASTLVSARALEARLVAYQKTNQSLNTRLDLTNTQLEQLVSAARDLRQSVLEAVAGQDGSGFGPTLEAQFGQSIAALNSNIGGNFLFSGARTNIAPVSVATLGDLQALPNVTDAFRNDDLRSQARIADNTDIDFGFLADEIGTDLLQAFRTIADYNSGPNGPIAGRLNQTQVDFLQSQLAAIDGAIERIQTAQLENGTYQKRVSELAITMEERADSVKVFISDIEDVDPAEAITRFNADRSALEASFRVLGSLSQLSLTRFL